MKNNECYTISKMIEYINKVEKYTNKITFEKFSNSEMIIDATIFAISQIGELVKNISKEFQNEYPIIKWNVIKGVRNRIIHDYEGINLKLIWAIITTDIPKLKKDLTDIIAQNKIKNN